MKRFLGELMTGAAYGALWLSSHYAFVHHDMTSAFWLIVFAVAFGVAGIAAKDKSNG